MQSNVVRRFVCESCGPVAADEIYPDGRHVCGAPMVSWSVFSSMVNRQYLRQVLPDSARVLFDAHHGTVER